MVVLLNAQKGMHPRPHLFCWSRSNTSSRLQRATLTPTHAPFRNCQWGTFIVTCPVVAEPTSFELTDVPDVSQSVAIPYRRSVDRRLDVVTCYSPLFYADRWQPFVAALELYRQFGASLQVFYVQSVLEGILRFLQAYERQGLVRIETWSALKLDKATLLELGYDPNVEIEWRNQPAAHTDCLLLFKEAAEFVIIVDIDDVLVPRRGATYVDEFREFAAVYPTAAAFIYPRVAADFASAVDPRAFSLSSLLERTCIRKPPSAEMVRNAGGKSVVRPSRVQTSWIHWPVVIDAGYYVQQLALEDNVMLHMRDWRAERANDPSWNTHKHLDLYERQMADFLSPANATSVGVNFESFVHEYAQKEFDSLPSRIRYYPLIQQCYSRTFYDLTGTSETCTAGPWKCEIPPLKNAKCAVAQRGFQRQSIRQGLQIHFSRFPAEFIVENDGCTL